MQYTTHNAAETMELGAQLSARLTGGSIIALHGELGGGKTTFVKGLAAALGITQTMVSPTFTLLQHYPLPAPVRGAEHLIHIDTYRLTTEEELVGIGALDYLGSATIIAVVEWPEKINNLLKNKTVVNVFFDHGQSENERIIRVA